MNTRTKAAYYRTWIIRFWSVAIIKYKCTNVHLSFSLFFSRSLSLRYNYFATLWPVTIIFKETLHQQAMICCVIMYVCLYNLVMSVYLIFHIYFFYSFIHSFIHVSLFYSIIQPIIIYLTCCELNLIKWRKKYHINLLSCALKSNSNIVIIEWWLCSLTNYLENGNVLVIKLLII